MLELERQRQVLRHLRAHGSGNVHELAQLLGVSESTVRRDLRGLHERGLLRRGHGGASLLDGEVEAVLVARAAAHGLQKQRIGQAAALLVPDGASVLLTGGSTTEAMVPFLGGRTNLTVVTNGLNVAVHLARHPEISVVVLGGVLRHQELSLLGHMVERALDQFHIDIAFTGAFGIDPAAGVFGADVREANAGRSLLRNAASCVVLADSSKLARRGPVRLLDTHHMGRLVTDDGAPTAAVTALRERGVIVDIVDTGDD